MTPRRFILLCGETEAAAFQDYLWGFDSRLFIERAQTVDALERLVDRFRGDARVLSFLSDLIVPEGVLKRLRLTPYNVHPGPPERPGAHPNCFALLEGASDYGVTAHEMIRRVDAGPIVGVRRFPIAPAADWMALADLAYAEAVRLFADVAAHCAMSTAPLPHAQDRWSGAKKTRADFAALVRGARPQTAEEAARFARAGLTDPKAAQAA
ncbi:MAG: formyltransferase family protein [Pseudomonadota bacterium]